MAKLSVSVHPDVMLAFANTSDTPLEDPRVQSPLLLVLEGSAIRQELGYEGKVIFDHEDLQIPKVLKDREFAASLLLKEAGVEDGFPIQIEAEGESHTLHQAAEIVQQRLLVIGLDAQIAPCSGACIRVFFRTGD